MASASMDTAIGPFVVSYEHDVSCASPLKECLALSTKGLQLGLLLLQQLHSRNFLQARGLLRRT